LIAGKTLRRSCGRTLGNFVNFSITIIIETIATGFLGCSLVQLLAFGLSVHAKGLAFGALAFLVGDRAISVDIGRIVIDQTIAVVVLVIAGFSRWQRGIHA
jgi:hypothetical protein